ncbi:chromate transporter [Pararhizobium gei]|uniref:chromate transporter n=1 Tax=Pararhizobium gei TaxID=1395951 RepID=UPI0023DB961F|nr:chromate transporter [Rhizobium gei]
MPHDAPIQPASLAGLFLVCLKIGLLSFGGGLSGWLYREFVEQKRWIDADDFASSMAISQMLPGANVINLVVCMGEQLRGPAGAIAGAFGFLIGPFFAVIGLSALIDSIANVGPLEAALAGVAAAATGLLIVICWHGVRRASRNLAGLAVVVVVAVTVGILDWPLLTVIGCLAPVSIAISWNRAGKTDA